MAADLAEAGELSSKQLKQLLDSAFSSTRTFPPSTSAKSRSRSPTPPPSKPSIDEVIAANPKQVEQYRGGKKTVAAFFVGQAMRLSKGQANPALLNELVAKKLDALGPL